MIPVVRVAAWGYASLTAVVVAFQVALALGAPWGAYAMGGSIPGRLPANARTASVVQALLLALTAVVVVSRAGLAFAGMSGASGWLIWVVVALLSLSLVGNLLSSSAGERMLWVPVIVMMLTASVSVGVMGG